MSAIRALLVDLDGTLTDNFDGIARSIRHALQALGAAAPPDAALRGCVGPPLRQSFARLLVTDDAKTIERALAHYRERYATTGWRENVVYPGIPAMLERLAASNARMLLCTSKPQPYAERIVAHFGLAPRFSAVYGADLGGILDDKSALVADLLLREALDPDECAMIGDREHDVHAAHANGTRAIGVLWGYGTHGELMRAGADAIAADPAAVPGALAGLGSR